LFLLTFVLFKNTQKEHEKNIILANYYSYNEQWDKVVGVAVSDTVYDVFMNYFFNRAIDNAGHFLDLFFDYPQYMGIDGLHPDKLNNIAIAFLSSDIYYDLGYISEATHWASEAQSVLPYSPRVLRRLALVNIIDGNFEAARKYLTVLDENFLNKDFVLKYMPYVDDTTLILRDKILSEKRSQIPYFNPAASDISDRFLQLLEKNSMNKRAYDHLEMSYLLEHQLGLFMKYLPLGKKFYKAMPEVFEQAFVLIMIAKGDNNLTQFKISQSTKELAQGYIKILKQNKKNKKVAKALLAREYANTYLYYAMFNSPLVTHAKLTVSEATEYK